MNRHGLEGDHDRLVRSGAAEGALYSARREFIDVAAVAIHLKQIAREFGWHLELHTEI